MIGNGMLRNALGFGAAGGALAGGLGQLGSQGLLGDLSSIISAPGDYTRGLLAGTPGERMGGRDLLRQYGLAGEEDTWGNFLAGMGTDLLTDPLAYAGALAGGGGKIAGNLMSPTLQESRLSRLAGQAATAVSPEAMLGDDLARFTPMPGGPLPTRSIEGMLMRDLPGMSPGMPMEEFLNPQVMAQLDDMALRINPRNAAWEALAQGKQQLAAPPMTGMPTPPSMPSAAQMIPPQNLLAGEGLGWNPMMAPPEFPSMQLPKTNPMMGGGTPLSLPADMQLNAGLGQAYGAQAMGMVPPMPMGAANTYQRVNPQVQALLEALGIPPEMQASFARGSLPPWAQVRGGNVMMSPGVLPGDVTRGASAAAGYR